MPYSPIWSGYRGDTDRVSKDVSNGGTALIQPPLGSKLFTLKNETFPASVFCTFFLPSLTNTEELSLWPAIKAPPIKHFMSGAAAIFVFPVDSHTEEFRNIDQRMRSQAVRNAWMTLCLGRRGAVDGKLTVNFPSNQLEGEEMKLVLLSAPFGICSPTVQGLTDQQRVMWRILRKLEDTAFDELYRHPIDWRSPNSRSAGPRFFIVTSMKRQRR